MNLPSQTAASLLTLDDVRARGADRRARWCARDAMHSRTLSQITGADIWLKFENLQFTAAYKERGALNAMLLLSRGTAQSRRYRGFGGQSRAGAVLSRHPAGHSGDHRHAAHHADGESDADRSRSAARWCSMARAMTRPMPMPAA
jgi:hypothetical protein